MLWLAETAVGSLERILSSLQILLAPWLGLHHLGIGQHVLKLPICKCIAVGGWGGGGGT